MTKTYHGSCLCGAVSFETENLLPNSSACHCGQCRKTSGHVWASSYTMQADVRFTSDRGLTWFKSSDWAQRGFCNQCGSSLFYRLNDDPRLIVAAGAWDDADHLKLDKHIFVADKAGYYDITCTAKQLQKY